MDQKKGKYLTLFLQTFELSAFTFGGGYVIVPLMRKAFVGKLGWLEDSEMLDLTAIAQSAPGPIAVNAAILVGFRTGGIPGALLSLLGAVLPPLIIIAVISSFYQAFRSNRYVSAVMAAMSAGVAAVVADAVISMVWDILRKKKLLPLIMMIAAFIMTEFLGVNIIVVIIAAGAAGYISYRWERRPRHDLS